MPLDCFFSTQHCCRALFILNEPPGLLPFPLLESKRELSTEHKRTSETSRRCDVPPRGAAGQGPEQLQPRKALCGLPLHPGHEPLAREAARAERVGETDLCPPVPAVARPPLRVPAPGPAEPGEEGGRMLLKPQERGCLPPPPRSGWTEGTSGERRLLATAGPRVCSMLPSGSSRGGRGRQNRAMRCTVTPLGSQGCPE